MRPRSTRIHHPCTVVPPSTRLIIALALTCVFANLACAQQKPATCADWFAVQRWSGTLTFSGSGTQTYTDGGSYTTSHSGTVTFTTDKGTNICDINSVSPANPGGWGWSAQSANVTQDVSIHDVSISFGTDDNNQRCEITTHYDIDHGTTSNRGAQINMTFNSATGGTYFLSAINFVDGVLASSTGCGHSGVSTTSLPWGPATNFTPAPVPSNIGMLSGSQQLTDVSEFGDITWTANWSATPYFSWDVLIKSNPDYAQWRPMAGRTENDLSSGLLGMVAYVVDKDTGEHVAGVSVDGWTFQLKDISHEPGVALNYPPKDKLVSPSPPDLDFKFVNDGIFPNVKVSDDGLTLEATPDPSTDSDIAVFMNSRDWGAWGTLNVQTTIAGQVVKAHFENEEATDILLPKRQQGSHIADSWKEEKNIPLDTADNDDSETDPVGRPGCTGDGLTLYEEYRGFMENGKHIEGDPTKKDFFVQNLGGGDMKPGIRKFAAITGLNVHKDLLRDEMDSVHSDGSLGDKLINFNHDQGAHEVDQHGVAIDVCPKTNGGFTHFTQTGVHGTPGLTTGICMEWKNHGDFFTPTSLGTGDTHSGVITKTAAASQYDVAVAHELAHSVGVDHHGDGDPGATRFTLLGPNDPRNTSGVPAFLMEAQTGIVHLLRETGEDIAPPMWAKLSTETTKACGQVAALYGAGQFSSICQAFVEGAVPLFTNLAFYVGKPQREHSGNDACIMRYFFANAYPSTGSSSTYYLSASGTEPVGNSLCPTPAGTGVNGPGHKPQPRYGNAAPNRGGCQKWVCVNDKYAPIPD